MKRYLIASIGCFFALAALAPPVFGDTTEVRSGEEVARPARVQFYAESGAQLNPTGGGPTGQLSTRVWIWKAWSADVIGRSGLGFYGASEDVNQFWTALALGPSYGLGRVDGWRLRLSPRVTHVHHASLTSWRETPGANVAGDSDGGVRHRTGGEFAVGVNGPPIGKIAHLELLWGADLAANVLPSSPKMNVGALMTVGFSLRGW